MFEHFMIRLSLVVSSKKFDYDEYMKKWITKFLKGFVYAYQGIKDAFRERNMRIHGIAAVTVLLLGIYFQIEYFEWAIVIILMAMVMAAEMVNTAIEDVCNTLRDTLHVPYKGTKVARDLAAGAVLVTAIASAIIGLMMFGPRIILIFS